ncbi:MAG: alpha/beta fold hydrolase [Candidatus Sericytochromatia bacterium]
MKLFIATILSLAFTLQSYSNFAMAESIENKVESDLLIKSKSIVLVHGMFMNPKSWENWKKYFEDKGYTVYTPAWPYHEGEPATLRENINPELNKLTFGQVYKSLANFIDSLPEKPIIIGHSMGGLLSQKLLVNGKGVAGIFIDSAPPNGLTSTKFSFIKSNLPVINHFAGDNAFIMDEDAFNYTFTNTMTKEESNKVREKYVVPESRNVARSITGEDGKVDVNIPHKPMLFIAGEKDNILPESLNKQNSELYTDKTSVVSFKTFKNRTHYIVGQDGWEEVAKYVENWFKDLPKGKPFKENKINNTSPTSWNVYTEEIINAPVEKVWAELTNFQDMPSWSKSLQSVNGEMKKDANVTVKFIDNTGAVNTYYNKLINYEKGKSFGWSDPFLPSLTDHHIYRVEALEDNKTKLIQVDEVNGISALFLGNIAANFMLRTYTEFNRTLKQRVENNK